MGIYSFCVGILQRTLQQACKLCEQSWVYNETHIGDSCHILPHLATCQWQHDMERESFRLVHPGAAGPGLFLRPGTARICGDDTQVPLKGEPFFMDSLFTVYIFILWHTMDVWDGDLYSWFITVLLHIVPCIFQTWDDRTSGCGRSSRLLKGRVEMRYLRNKLSWCVFFFF